MGLAADEDLDLKLDYLEKGSDVNWSKWPKFFYRNKSLKLKNTTNNQSIDIELEENAKAFDRRIVKFLRAQKIEISSPEPHALTPEQNELFAIILQEEWNLYLKNNIALIRFFKNAAQTDQFMLEGNIKLEAKEIPGHWQLETSELANLSISLTYDALLASIARGEGVEFIWPKGWAAKSNDLPNSYNLAELLKDRREKLIPIITLFKQGVSLDYFVSTENGFKEFALNWMNQQATHESLSADLGDRANAFEFSTQEQTLAVIAIEHVSALQEELSAFHAYALPHPGANLTLDFTTHRAPPTSITISTTNVLNEFGSSRDQFAGNQEMRWSCGVNGHIYFYRKSHSLNYFHQNHLIDQWWKVNGVSLKDIPENQASIIYEKFPTSNDIKQVHIIGLSAPIYSLQYVPGYPVHDNTNWKRHCYAPFGYQYVGFKVPDLAGAFSDEVFTFE